MTNELLINSVSPVSEQIEQAEQTEQTEQTVSNEYVRMARRALDLVDADDAIRENQFAGGSQAVRPYRSPHVADVGTGPCKSG